MGTGICFLYKVQRVEDSGNRSFIFTFHSQCFLSASIFFFFFFFGGGGGVGGWVGVASYVRGRALNFESRGPGFDLHRWHRVVFFSKTQIRLWVGVPTKLLIQYVYRTKIVDLNVKLKTNKNVKLKTNKQTN